MHMVHSIINGNPASPVNLGGGSSAEEESGGEEERKHRKLSGLSPKITSKGGMDKDSKDALIKKIMAENAKLAQELSNKTA